MPGGFLGELPEQRAVDVAKLHEGHGGSESEYLLNHKDKDISERENHGIDSKHPEYLWGEIGEVALRQQAHGEIADRVGRE